MVREGSRSDDDGTVLERGNPPAGARSDPFGEARRHLQLGDLRGAARALADLRTSAPSSPSAHRAEAARQLCLAGIEHERRAAVLDKQVAAQWAAARRSRAQVEALLQDTVVEPDARGGDVTPPGGPPPLALVPDPSDPPRPPDSPRKPALPSPEGLPAAPSTGGPANGLVARLLGHFEVEWQGRPVSDWGSLRGRTILQYLLIDPRRPVRRDVLMELLWPGYSAGSARNNLNVAIYSLRRSLLRIAPGPHVVLHRDGCYLLNPDLTIATDREAFLAELAAGAAALGDGDVAAGTSAFERAVALYRGPLFDDEPSGEWFFAEQRLLEERALEAHEQLAGLHIERGEPASALQSAQAALRLDPCRESAHRLVMRAYASLQQTQSVARQYRLCVEALASQLGLGPAPETTQLFQRLANVS